jgi:hypothetical protein
MSQRKKAEGHNRSQKRRKPTGKKQLKKSEHDPVSFWGESAALPTPESFTTEVSDPMAMLHSLGPAPLDGVVAAPYFAAVYARAAGLASILSEAAGLGAVTSAPAVDAPASPTDPTSGSATSAGGVSRLS